MGFIEIIFILVIYFIPAIVAYDKEHRNFRAIIALNVLLGWTLIGWVAALVWAMSKPSTLTVTLGDSSRVKPAPTMDMLDKIEKLGKLREAGHLTDDEFLLQKTRLLGNDPKNPATRWTKAPVTVMAVESTDHHDSDHDAVHHTFTQPVGIGACEVETLIKYCDAHGGKTFRPIVIRNVERDQDGHIYLRSYCKLRHMARTFRADRIECFADGDGVITGTRDYLIRTLKIDPTLIPA